MEHRRGDIVGPNGVRRRVGPDAVGAAVDLSATHAAAGEQHAVALRPVIPAILRKDAAIADDVVVIGSDDHLIVWNEERIQRRLAENPLTDEDYKELELHGV